jgi:hypothetical protein
MGEWERFNQSWRMKWTVECDGCHSKVEVETLTEHPPHDNCPSCRAQGGYAPLPPASSEHYAQYAVSGSGVTATCSCHWSATSPGMPGARAAMEAHREAVAEDRALCHPAPESMYRDAGFGG